VKKLILSILFFGLLTNAWAQIQIEYITPKQDLYSFGDTIKLMITLKTLPETCASGMKQAKVYLSGLQIENQTDWKELKKGLWHKQLTLIVISNKKKEAKLTVARKVDKESLFKQEIITVTGH
jgi:hypothetical protein